MGERLEEQLVVKQAKIRFDGGENPAKWKSYGIPKGLVPDHYIASCEGGGVNLHILKIGVYIKCGNCSQQELCRETALVAGEQMD